MPKPIDNRTASPVVFVDKAFKSRTLVLPDDRCFPVEKARISAEDPMLVEYLDKHPDFERQATE